MILPSAVFNHKWAGKLVRRLPAEQRLLEVSKGLVRKHQLQPWFEKHPLSRPYHYEICRYLKENFSKKAHILETGCGIGQSFVLYSRMGFKNLYGIEKDTATFAALQELIRTYEIPAEVHCDSGENTLKHFSAGNFDAVLPLNWTYFASNLTPILQDSEKLLKPGGTLIIDLINPDHVPKTEREKSTFEKYPHKHRAETVVKASSLQKVLEFEDGARQVLFLRKSYDV